MQVVAAKAVALRLAATEEFRRDQARTIENAHVLADTIAAAGARLVSGGTDNHLALVDVTPMGVTGREAEALLDDVGITVNKNAIPFDANPPNIGSGIRIGTPATTTRGMGPDEMRTIGHLVVEAMTGRDDAGVHPRIREDVRELVARFPVPGLPRDRA
jgi:glycine hydroxymethyltransferase